MLAKTVPGQRQAEREDDTRVEGERRCWRREGIHIFRFPRSLKTRDRKNATGTVAFPHADLASGVPRGERAPLTAATTAVRSPR
jgi:hypothetical protein